MMGRSKPMKCLFKLWVSLLLLLLPAATSNHWGSPNLISHFGGKLRQEDTRWNRIRGGETPRNEDDSERYSRQVYTLGARAHGLVRSTTIYIDGPSKSGLVYECAKNLALSGAGHMVIIASDDAEDSEYFLQDLDDLGKTYCRAANAELGNDGIESTRFEGAILQEYLKRLNPSVKVATVSRTEFERLEQGSGVIVCVDRPFETQLKLNRQARKSGFAFVAVETAGVYGRIFCDFGETFEVHDLDGEQPLVVPLDHIESIEGGPNGVLVSCVEGENHDVSKGDKIQFKDSRGCVVSQSLKVVNVLSPHQFSALPSDLEDFVRDDFIDNINSKAVAFSRIKIPLPVSFLPLKEAVNRLRDGDDVFTASDLDKSFDAYRRSSLFSCFQALSNFVANERRMPSTKDFSLFFSLVKSDWKDENSINMASAEKNCQLFFKCCAAKFAPLQAIFGAIAAQEALKAATGLYNPIQQFLMFDCDEILPASEDYCQTELENFSGSGQAYILGKELEEKLQSKRIFVVGTGAIGCEILKNLAAMGAGSQEEGCVIVTDMDTIERSNLSRQLLFRDSDIGKFKSIAAENAIRRFNPQLKFEAHTSKVGDEENGPFGEDFWSNGADVILNALDNVEARLFMDGRCVANQLPMVDAGTLGSKGNVQVVVPHRTESYGSSPDPPEPSIPVCTLKTFPYAISHTIQWGRDLFDGLFVRRARQANEYGELLSSMEVSAFAKKLIQELGEESAVSVATELGEDLARKSIDVDINSLREDSIQWAISVAKKLFFDDIEALIRQHPEDSLDEDGEPFWSGTRKFPKPLSFVASKGDLDLNDNTVNESIINFVQNAARLRIETFDALSSSGSSVVTQEEVKVALSRAVWNSAVSNENDEGASSLSRICNSLKTVAGEIKPDLVVAEFEKDDESNGHVAFVAAASNLRAICYGIPPVDAMETRRVAGKIVPAMITTTAFVSALSCIELIKLIQDVPLEIYRNAFINLALPFFAFTVPLPAEEIPGLQGKVYTIWDRITIKEGKKVASEGGMTLRRLLKRIKAKACSDPDLIEITTVSFGEYMIYANFLHEGDEEIMDKAVVQLVEESVLLGQEFENEFSRDKKRPQVPTSTTHLQSSLDLTVVVEDLESGEEFQLPPVRLLNWKKSR